MSEAMRGWVRLSGLTPRRSCLPPCRSESHVRASCCRRKPATTNESIDTCLTVLGGSALLGSEFGSRCQAESEHERYATLRDQMSDAMRRHDVSPFRYWSSMAGAIELPSRMGKRCAETSRTVGRPAQQESNGVPAHTYAARRPLDERTQTERCTESPTIGSDSRLCTRIARNVQY